MESIDDLYYFYLVVKHSGFSAASDASHITKSKLSRRIQNLEDKYNVQLIQRSTRHFSVTPLGEEFYVHCTRALEEIEQAKNVLLQEKHVPNGLIRLSCPPLMMQNQIRPILNDFLKRYPDVRVELELSSRRYDVVHENIDIAVRTNFEANENSNLIIRDVTQTWHCLVAHRDFLARYPIQSFEDLQHVPTIALGNNRREYSWKMCHIQDHREVMVPHNPRVKSSDLAGIEFAVMDGLGVADLPFLTVEKAIERGEIVRLFPDWYSNVGTVQLVYASRRQRTAVKVLIEELVEKLRVLSLRQSGYFPHPH